MFYRLSRLSPVHVALRKVAYGVLKPLPEALKASAFHTILSRRLPYSLVQPDWVVVQIGTPWDILETGRSRAIHFSKRLGPNGKLVVIEPDPKNVAAFQSYIDRNKLDNVILVPKGVWDAPGKLRFLSDPENPASNLVESVFDEKRTDLERFESTEVEVDTLDSVLTGLGLVGAVNMVSITANGAENHILAGMSECQKGVQYIATIADESEFPLLTEYGFSRYGHDDRGYTFSKVV